MKILIAANLNHTSFVVVLSDFDIKTSVNDFHQEVIKTCQVYLGCLHEECL